ncbi:MULTISPECIES: LysR family transcriptional regulator [Nocardia]|nr:MULTISPECIES: LysR family transcriptional regulator [Nocardia]
MSEHSLSTPNSITLRQFDYFVSTVRLGSMSAAARKFGVTPSAMSQQIGALEVALGRKLFDPQSRRSSLTKFGREFFAQASTVVDHAYQALAIGQSFSDGVLTIGTTSTIAHKLMPPLIYRLRLQCDIDNIEVRSFATMYDLGAALDRGTIDLAIGPLTRSSAKFVHTVGEEELVVACHRSQESRFDGTWQRLAEVPWIGYCNSSDIAKTLVQESGRANVDIRYVVTAPDVPTALSLVEHGIGIALVPKMALHNCSRLLSVTRPAPRIKRKLSVHVKDMSPYIEKFLGVVSDMELIRKFRAAGLLEVR